MGAPSVTAANFQAEVLNSDKPVLVDFWPNGVGLAEWLLQFSMRLQQSMARS